MAFTYRLEQEDGTPAKPPILHTAVPTWQAGDTIPLGKDTRTVSVRSLVAARAWPDQLSCQRWRNPRAAPRAAPCEHFRNPWHV